MSGKYAIDTTVQTEQRSDTRIGIYKISIFVKKFVACLTRDPTKHSLRSFALWTFPPRSVS
jgi:hypothetical protein